MYQVGLAQADAAINEQRVVKLPQAAGNMHGCSATHTVSRAFNQGIKGQRSVEAAFKRNVGRVYQGD